jgi:hypothetical protein
MREIVHPSNSFSRSGRHMVKGFCAVCGCKICMFVSAKKIKGSGNMIGNRRVHPDDSNFNEPSDTPLRSISEQKALLGISPIPNRGSQEVQYRIIATYENEHITPREYPAFFNNGRKLSLNSLINNYNNYITQVDELDDQLTRHLIEDLRHYNVGSRFYNEALSRNQDKLQTYLNYIRLIYNLLDEFTVDEDLNFEDNA